VESKNLKEGKTVYYYIGEKLGKFVVMHTIFMDDSTDKNRINAKNEFTNPIDAGKILDEINNLLSTKPGSPIIGDK